MNCRYCGLKPGRQHPTEHRLKVMKRKINGVVFVNGIDRLDNKLGYTMKNIVPCCEFCNRAKGGMPSSIWEEWIERIRSNEGLFTCG